jgi:hypothetical protein
MITFAATAVEVPPTPLGLLQLTGRSSPRRRTCHQVVPGNQLVAHAKLYQRAGNRPTGWLLRPGNESGGPGVREDVMLKHPSAASTTQSDERR